MDIYHTDILEVNIFRQVLTTKLGSVTHFLGRAPQYMPAVELAWLSTVLLDTLCFLDDGLSDEISLEFAETSIPQHLVYPVQNPPGHRRTVEDANQQALARRLQQRRVNDAGSDFTFTFATFTVQAEASTSAQGVTQ
jgi:hypothetical protein